VPVRKLQVLPSHLVDGHDLSDLVEPVGLGAKDLDLQVTEKQNPHNTDGPSTPEGYERRFPTRTKEADLYNRSDVQLTTTTGLAPRMLATTR
jgi:hypothetical protein